MTLVSALAFAVLEILGLGVVGLEGGGVLALGPETLIVGDVLAVGGGAPLVSWCGGGLPEPELDTRCFLGEVRPGGTSDRARRPVFQMPAALCGNSRLRLLRMAEGVVGTTVCSRRSGRWAWAQTYDRRGEARTVQLPVAPHRGWIQTAPVPVPGPATSVWVVWTEEDEGGRGLGTVRAIRLDSGGEPTGQAITLSDSESGAVVGSTVSGPLGAAGLPGGGLAVAWFERVTDGHAIRLGIFDAAGRAAASPMDLGAATFLPFEPLRVAADESGRVAVTWWRAEADDGGTRLYAASFSPRGEPLVEPVSVARLPTGVFPRIAALAARDDAQLLAWNDRDPDTGEPRISLRRWSPERGPLGVTTWIAGTVAESWPFLDLVPGGEPRRFTVYWKETVEAPEGGSAAVLRWRELAVPESPSAGARPAPARP